MMTMPTKRLYRAASGTSPDFGFGTCWAGTAAHARLYTHRLDFGGPAVYVVDVTVDDADIYDLTNDPVGALNALGFDPYSQSPVECGYRVRSSASESSRPKDRMQNAGGCSTSTSPGIVGYFSAVIRFLLGLLEC